MRFFFFFLLFALSAQGTDATISGSNIAGYGGAQVLEDYDNSQSSSSGFQLSSDGEGGFGLPTFNIANSSTEKTGTTYATLGQGTFTIGGETVINDQGATLTSDQIAYLTQNPGSVQANTPGAVVGSDHYGMTQENFAENVVLNVGALDVIAGSQDYELIYSLNGEWTPTQQGKFDAAMSDTLGDLFTSGDASDFLDRAGDNLNPEVSYTGATDKIGSLINGLNDNSISAADLGLPEGTTAEDAVEYLSGLLTGEDGTPLSDEDLSNNLAAMLDPAPSENCWDNPDAACDGVDADGRLFAGGDAIIAEDGPLAGANLNIGAAQTGLDVIEQEFQLDLNLQKVSELSVNIAATRNLMEAVLPPMSDDSDELLDSLLRKAIVNGADISSLKGNSDLVLLYVSYAGVDELIAQGVEVPADVMAGLEEFEQYIYDNPGSGLRKNLGPLAAVPAAYWVLAAIGVIGTGTAGIDLACDGEINAACEGGLFPSTSGRLDSGSNSGSGSQAETGGGSTETEGGEEQVGSEGSDEENWGGIPGVEQHPDGAARNGGKPQGVKGGGEEGAREDFEEATGGEYEELDNGKLRGTGPNGEDIVFNPRARSGDPTIYVDGGAIRYPEGM